MEDAMNLLLKPESNPIIMAAMYAVNEGLAPQDSDGLGTLFFLNP
jgi:hypothetical protein